MFVSWGATWDLPYFVCMAHGAGPTCAYCVNHHSNVLTVYPLLFGVGVVAFLCFLKSLAYYKRRAV